MLKESFKLRYVYILIVKVDSSLFPSIFLLLFFIFTAVNSNKLMDGWMDVQWISWLSRQLVFGERKGSHLRLLGLSPFLYLRRVV